MSRPRSQATLRREAVRAATLRKHVYLVESLEQRELLATIPAAQVSLQQNVADAFGGNMSSPSIAVNPLNALQVVSVWTRIDPNLAPGPTVVVEGAFSSNGGVSWTAFNPTQEKIDPASSSTAPAFYAQTTDAHVDFDRNGNFYVLSSQHAAGNADGELDINKFSFGSTNPTVSSVAYSWAGDGQALKPTLAVDQNVSTFTDHNSQNQAVTQSDPFAGAVYVAWGTVDNTPTGATNWNPNAIKIIASTDGGTTFSGSATVNDNGNFGSGRETAPQLTISQGSATVPGGQVSIVWDDFGSGATATPTPFDIIWADKVQGIRNVTATTSGQITNYSTTDFPLNIAAGGTFGNVADLTVRLQATSPTLNALTVDLIAPDGTDVPLVLKGNITGTNLGFGTNGPGTGTSTTIDANAFKALASGAAPFIGTFAPAGNLATFENQPIQNGGWKLRVTDTTAAPSTPANPPPFQFLFAGSLTITSGLTPGADTAAAFPTVRGAVGAGGPTTSAAMPGGIAPDASLASDNTLGAFSPHQGRIYLTYVDRIATAGNPADNTDVYLKFSDDGGSTWSGGSIVNDDDGLTDGFSEGFDGISGREQFAPSVAVDQSTGTLVITYYDGRYDAARARVATTIATSIDGGATFGPQMFANTPLVAKDQATGQNVVVGPILDNNSSGNNMTGKDTTFGFGQTQSVAVADGHVYPAWSGNQNGGDDGKELLGIQVAQALITSGPRIISSTEGPVGLAGDTLNNQTGADGGPEASAFLVTFDRPVDPATFVKSAVQVFYHDTVAGSALVSIPVISVTALNTNTLGATEFRVNFTASAGVGTYSYKIAPVIQDRIRSVQTITTPVGGRTTENSTDTPKPIPDVTTIDSNLVVTGFPVNEVVNDLTVNLSINHTFDSDLIITLISPSGTRVILSDRNGGAGHNYTNTTFSDTATSAIGNAQAPFTGTFTPDQALSSFRGVSLNGTWTLEVADVAFEDSGTLLNWSFNVQPGTTTTSLHNGNAMDQNANATPGQPSDDYEVPTPTSGTSFTAPYSISTLPLIVPGPHVISSSVPSGVVPTTSDNLVLNTTASSIDVTFDRDMDPTTFTAAQVLQVMGPAGLISGPYTVTQIDSRTFQVGFPTQQLSGTYTVTLGAGIKSANGDAVDNNLNAGLDVLRGTSTTAPTTVNFSATTVPVTIAPSSKISSTITISNDFPIQGLTLTLNATFANDPSLTAVLIAPDGTQITLFSGVGATGTEANFQNTVFDDSAATPISNGGPPFFGRFRPQDPLSVLFGSSSVSGPGGTGSGVYTLQITNSSTSVSGTLNSWSLSLLKPTSGTGLGEPVADRSQLSFRIYNMDPTNPLASSTWTPVGAASTNTGSNSGRIGAIAVDPSDPTGNTVYIAGATGGVWRTNDFLTTNPAGPTYIPLTDFGPNSAINIGGLAIFPRNNDPNQSIIIAATGDGDGGAPGVGFLRSMDGGSTWALLDSTNNTLLEANRDHVFLGNTSYKVVVDPNLTAAGGVIIYAAMSGTNGGIWRSIDTGNTWQLMKSGQATDVVLDPNSGTVDVNSNPTGNLRVVYAGITGQGVFLSPNQGQVWNILAGVAGDPLIENTTNPPPKPVTVTNLPNPNGAQGRIVLAKPALFPSTDPNAALKNLLYQGWLYAAVVTPNSHLLGLYLTKDQGQSWTQLKLPFVQNDAALGKLAVPSNNASLPSYDIAGNMTFAQGNYDISLAVDPNNPNITYLGGTQDGNPTGLIRVDATTVLDSHSFYLPDDQNDGGTLMVNSTAGVTLAQNPLPGPSGFDPRLFPTLNLIRQPSNPLGGSATIVTSNTTTFANSGADVKWIPFDQAVDGTTDQHRVIAMRDPVTGLTRLIFGDDQGVFTAVDDGTGNIVDGIGTASSISAARSGNLQITQYYYGAAQPSSAAAQIAGALFYGQAQDDGSQASDPNVLTNGNINWTGPTGDGTGVATDQTGSGTVYRFNWPCCGGQITNFFQVQVDGSGPFIGRTFGLIQTSGTGTVPDPQWPNVAGSNFRVNPIDGDQIVISSQAGRIFRTQDQGLFWSVIADPSQLDGTYAPALAYGAPVPSAPTVGALDDFIYVGTSGGHIYVTFTGGGNGTGSNAWININNGALAGNTAPVQEIITDPTRGSREAYAVTSNGVYYIADSNPSSGDTWVSITGNLFSITRAAFGVSDYTQAYLSSLSSIQADWRYAIPDNPANPNGPTHPLLYVGGNGGVFTSSDKGVTWIPFPSTQPNSLATTPTPPGAGGGLPVAAVDDLNMSIGNIDPTTGRAVAATGDPNVLLATTYGRGDFAIKLAPIVFASDLSFDTTLPAPSGSTTGTDSQGRPLVTVAQPVIDGISEQTAFGNVAKITLWDETDPTHPVLIGGFNPADPSTDIAANHTDSFGHFQIQVNANAFTTNGVKTIGVQATDASGTQGNMALITFTLQAKVAPTTPPTAPTLMLNPSDDTSGGFDITKINNPHVIGVSDPFVTIAIFNSVGGLPSGSALVTGSTDLNGNYILQLPAMPDGTYHLIAVATNTHGSTNGGMLTFTIKTTAPTTKPTLLLNPADDTGVVGDNVTSSRHPHFIGVADPLATITLYRVVSGVRVETLGSIQADSSGHYSLQLPNALSNGTITLQVGETDVAKNQGPYSNPLTVSIVGVAGDFTGAGKATPIVFTRNSNGSIVYTYPGVTPTTGIIAGSSALDIPFEGDFDGDGIADIATYRPSTQTWTIIRSSLGTVSFQLGSKGSIPTVGDFDGDGVTDVAAYNASTGTFTIAESSAGTKTVTFPTTGTNAFSPALGDTPVPANYDGGIAVDPAIYRPSTNSFLYLSGSTLTTVSISTGTTGDVPVSANYDNSASYSKADPAVYNPTTGLFAILGPNGKRIVAFKPNDIPAVGDYAGTGVIQTAVYRPSTATFVITGMANPIAVGTPAAVPLASPLVYRNVGPTIALASGSDTGFVGDNVTSTRQPTFTGSTNPNVTVYLVIQTGQVVGTTTSDANGNYAVTASALGNLGNGSYVFKTVASGTPSLALNVKLVTVSGDYNGDGKTDPAMFRKVSSNNTIQWFVQSNPALLGISFGAASVDIPLAADLYGNGKTDLLVYRSTTAQWFVANPATGYAGTVFNNNFGWAGVDIPVPADYAGTGQAQIAVFRPTNGFWFVNGLPTINAVVPPQTGDIAVPADYTGNGHADPAIYRPSTAQWFIETSNGTVKTVNFGGAGYVPVPGAYDATSGNPFSEPALWSATTGQYIINGPNGNRVIQFAAGDIPAPGDYLGNGTTQAAVYRPSTGQWLMATSTSSVPTVFTTFGDSSFTPVQSPFRYRTSGGGTITAQSISSDSTVTGTDTVSIGSSTKSTSNAATTTTASSTTPTSPVSVSSFQGRHRPNTAQKEALFAIKALHHKPLHRAGFTTRILERHGKI